LLLARKKAWDSEPLDRTKNRGEIRQNSAFPPGSAELKT
jgi:hypothetical protein